MLGYAECAGELVNQCAAAGITPGCVVHASASAGTQAGLIYGFGALSSATRVLGINVFHPNPQTLGERVADLLTAMEEKFGGLSERPAIETNHAYFGEGYGIPTTEACEAINWVASMEGLYFDPVYSGKALAGLLDQINVGAFRDCEDVVFIHTGGAPSLHVYEDLLNSHL